MISRPYDEIKLLIENYLKKEFSTKSDLIWSKPPSVELGDISFPLFNIAKELKIKPEKLSEKIIAEISFPDIVEKVNLQGGFLNLTFNRSIFVTQVLQTILEQTKYGQNSSLSSERIIVEHTSSNPTGPLHIGNFRGSVLGDVLGRLFSFLGAAVNVRYYVNDLGRQIAPLVIGYFLLKEAKYKIEKLHDVAIELATCESEKCIFQETENALESIFGISDVAFFRKEKNHLVLKTKKHLDLFKTRYKITEGIAGKVFNSDNVCIYSHQSEFSEFEPAWEDIESVIGCRIGDEDIFLAVSHNERAFNKELAEILSILFKHTNGTLKRIKYENLLKKKAVIDPLTNVYNRLYYDQAIKYEMKLSKRYKYNIGFIVVDINNLKKINDEHGHNLGDKALKFVASLLVSQARDSDNVIRSGGDEFLLMLPQTGEEVEIVEKRMRSALISYNKKSKLPFPVTFAIGSAFWNIEMNKTIEEIIKEADNKMYADKQNSAKSRKTNGK